QSDDSASVLTGPVAIPLAGIMPRRYYGSESPMLPSQRRGMIETTGTLRIPEILLAPAASPDRGTLVEQARKAWIDQIVDSSRRNNLLYFRDLKTGTLDFSSAEPDAIAALLAEDAVPLHRLLP